jgi:uncharacterized lipoprotein YddW (UPF0748 family)
MKRLFLLAALSAFWGASCTIHPPAHHRQPPPAPAPKPMPTPPPRPPTRPVTELRGIWVSDTTRLDWNAATRQLQQHGFNAMFVNLAAPGRRFFPPAGAVDPIERGIRLAHERGIAVHAKVIVMFAFKADAEFQQKFVGANRVMRGADGKPILQSGFIWICPSNERNLKELMAGYVREIISRYPVDGVQFDYIRFNENPSCFCSHCRQQFEQRVSAKIKRWPADVMTGAYADRFQQWRVDVINTWMQELSQTVRRVRPQMVISAAVFPDLGRAREEKGQDWKTWLDRGDVDYICPMNYVTDPADFAGRLQETQAAARPGKVVCGIGSWKFKDKTALTRQINTTRRLGASGFILFSWDDAAARKFLPNLAPTR